MTQRIETFAWRVVTLIIMLSPAVALCQKSTQERSAPQYEIMELPFRPVAISGSAWVAGSTEDQHAATWSTKSGLYRIPMPAGFSFSECTGINSRGDAVGTASSGDFNRRVAFVLRQKKFSLLEGQQSRANDINESGDVAGQAIFPGAKAAGPVLWKAGSMIDLHICCAGLAHSINDQDVIAGDTYDKEGHYHAFVWKPSHPAQLPGDQYSSAVALNSRGDILLKVIPGGLVLYASGERHALNIPQATPRAMNRYRVIVGSFGANPERQRAFVWDKEHGMQDLNMLIPAVSNWTLEVATSINDRGEIVGWGDKGREENLGFLLRLRKRRPPRQASPR